MDDRKNLHFSELSNMVKKHKNDKEERFKDSSKKRLYKIASKKVQTTMIGALSSIENHFGFLWGHQEGEEKTPEQETMRELFEEVRAEILDRGNHQIRNMETEFNQYDIKWLRYTLTLPVATNTNDIEEDDNA